MSVVYLYIIVNQTEVAVIATMCILYQLGRSIHAYNKPLLSFSLCHQDRERPGLQGCIQSNVHA